MTDCILAMKTQTAAERARRIAVMEKIPVEVVSIDPYITRRGCSIGIRLPCSSVLSFQKMLDRKKIPYGDVIGRGGY